MDKATHAPPPRIALSYREQEKNDEIHRNPCPLSLLSPAVLVDVTGEKDLLRRVRDRCSDDAQGARYVQNIVVDRCGQPLCGHGQIPAFA